MSPSDTPPDPAADRAIGVARAEAALALGAKIAGGRYYARTLFADRETSAVRLPDPVRPVSHLLVTRLLKSAVSSRFVEQLFATVAQRAPGVALIAFEFADYDGFRPVAVQWSDDSKDRLFNHRTMAVRAAAYGGSRRVRSSGWFDLPHALPWPYLRDLLIPFEVTRGGRHMPGFVQPFHPAAFVPLQHWLQQAFDSEALCYTAFCADAGTGRLFSNHQDHGGGLVPVTPTIAIVGRGMSVVLKEALRRNGIDLVEADPPTDTEHVDELFAVLPCPAARCGRALVALSPVAADGGEATAATVAAIERSTRSVHEALRQKAELADLPRLELPVAVSGRETVDFNPVNMLSIPVDGGVLCLMGRPGAAELEAEYREALRRIGESLGCPVEPGFIDLHGVAPGHKGSLHCATVELRRA